MPVPPVGGPLILRSGTVLLKVDRGPGKMVLQPPMRLLLITPPMTQVNTPYPATAYLTGFLRQRGYEVQQADFSLELFLRLFSRSGLERVFSVEQVRSPKRTKTFLTHKNQKATLPEQQRYLDAIDPVVQFLQHRDPTLAHRIVMESFLPRGPRFQAVTEMEAAFGDSAFGDWSLQDKAQYFASLFIDDIADYIRQHIDPRFELARYAEKLAASAPSFDPIREAVLASGTVVDTLLDALTREWMEREKPDVIGLTAPFPGNVYGAFRIARVAKLFQPQVKVVLGGGYPNTELRELADPRVFDFIDFITLDDGEAPLEAILRHLESPRHSLLRTLVREAGKVVQKSSPSLHDVPFKTAGTPSYQGLKVDSYVSLVEMPNPMHRLWSDGFWNKLTVAHGCYWKRCTFCDTSLDYINRYEPETGDSLLKKMESLIQQTGSTGFHFVDEAAPPKVLVALAKAILKRGLVVSWWGNIRFEKHFDQEVADLLARSGCIALTGGLEVASNRLLGLMQKGVTVEQVAQVTHALSDSGILVHAYLMYGFPTQTVQETVDSLERVRQLFESGCLHSAFWHRFSVTEHSPVGKNPQAYGIELQRPRSTFAKNDIPFSDSTGVDHDALYSGLRKAVYNYMHGLGLDEDVRSWFEIPVPKAKVSATWLRQSLATSCQRPPSTNWNRTSQRRHDSFQSV